MADEVRTPFVVKLCQLMIGLAAYLVPSSMRADWKRERLAEIWHQWRFLFYVKEWDGREILRLLRTGAGAFSDAASYYRAYPEFDKQRREWIRSPWTTLGALFAGLALIACISSGFSATRLLFTGTSRGEAQQVFLWMHSLLGARDRGLPADVVPAWAKYSKTLQAVAPFNIDRRRVESVMLGNLSPLVVDTEPSIFNVLQVRPILGELPKAGALAEQQKLSDLNFLVIDYRTWKAAAKSNPKVIGSRMRIGSESFPVAAVLPKQFYFLSRHPLVLLVHQSMNSSRVMVVARARPNATKTQLYRELIKIAEDACYYYSLAGQLRLEYLSHAIWAPVQFFGIAALVAVLMAVFVCGVRPRNIRLSWTSAHSAATVRRMSYFLAKTMLALLLVLFTGLEWSRPESAILLASKDPASGLFLVWFFIVGAMGVLFWSIADQRARCKECLRLLCSPVRIGCPGCLLLDWSGTELLCSEGHGVLHVPELASTWDIDSEQWITLDESWRGLFADSK